MMSCMQIHALCFGYCSTSLRYVTEESYIHIQANSAVSLGNNAIYLQNVFIWELSKILRNLGKQTFKSPDYVSHSVLIRSDLQNFGGCK